MLQKKVLLVEDDVEQSQFYQAMLKKLGHQVAVACGKDEAVEILQAQAIDILVTDIHLTNSAERNSFEGFEVLKFSKANSPETLAIAMSNDPKVSTYNEALELGALSFVKKPVCSMGEFELAILAAREKKDYKQLKAQMVGVEIADGIMDKRCQDGLVLDDNTREMVGLLSQAKELPCIICGESGTGKEEVAKLIHKKRVAKEGALPFIAVNCANLDAATAASQLFGHRRGSFTGANDTTTGYVGEANGGILFLDEIHTLSIDCQRKLLRVLNDGTYQRFGDTKTLHSEFQVIVATGKDLDGLVQQGTFIPDLRSRITGIMIDLKPLRERLDDMALLVRLFFAKLRVDIAHAQLQLIVEKCKTFYWQDNIRQLSNTLKTTALICQCKKKPITAADLQIYPSMYAPDHEGNGSLETSNLGVPEEVIKEILMPMVDDQPLDEAMDKYEMLILKNAIARHKVIAKVVDKLKVSRSTLDMKRKKYRLGDE